jgi:general secretion pathway protein A
MDTDLEYIKYWDLVRPPFSLAPCPDGLFMSKQHGECLLRLKYGVMAGKGGSLLVSENAGDGKTTVLRRLAADLPKELDCEVRTAFIDHPTLTPTQMLQEILRQLGVAKPPRSKNLALNRLREHLIQINEDGGKCVVIVDEGQMLEHRPDLLQELRILLNFCAGDQFLLSFILSGQIALEGVVRSMPEFWQRLPVRFYLRNLDIRDTRDLVRHRLTRAGLPEGREIFTADGFEEIFKTSEGCPRVICSVADLALVVGRSQLIKEIGATQVRQAWADMENKSSCGFHYYHFLSSASDAHAVRTLVASEQMPGEPAPAAAPSGMLPPAAAPPGMLPPSAQTAVVPSRTAVTPPPTAVVPSPPQDAGRVERPRRERPARKQRSSSKFLNWFRRS